MKRTLFLVIVVIAVLCSATLIYYNQYFVLERQVIPMDVKIEEKVGFVLDNDALHFGSTYPGGSSQREVWFINNYTIPVKVRISNYGDLGPHVKVSDNNFWMGPDTRRMITFVATVPSDVINITMTGTTKVLFTRG